MYVMKYIIIVICVIMKKEIIFLKIGCQGYI